MLNIRNNIDNEEIDSIPSVATASRYQKVESPSVLKWVLSILQ